MRHTAATHALLRIAAVMSVARPPPPLVVFDLDACCWYPEMYQLWGDSPPFAQTDDPGVLRTARGTAVKLLGDVRAIWRELHETGVAVAIASRCDEPDWARECLRKYVVCDRSGTTMWDVAHPRVEIYKGSKTGHFRELHRKTAVPFAQMLFFDDDPANIRDVASLGVTCVLTPNGVTRECFEQGMRAYLKKVAAGAP